MTDILNQAMNTDRHLTYDFQNIFTEKIDQLFDNISYKLSHVLLASKHDSEAMIAVNNIYKTMSHISSEDYFDRLEGTVFRKNMDSFVANSFRSMSVPAVLCRVL